MYVINFENIIMMLKCNYFETDENTLLHKNYSCIISKPDSPLSQYIGENMRVYMEVMLEACNGSITDDEDAAKSLLNNPQITSEQKKTYISYYSEKIKSIQGIQDTSLWARLLDKNIARLSGDNVWSYYEAYGIDNHLINFINRGNSVLNLVNASRSRNDDAIEMFFSECLKCTKLNTDRYMDILTTVGHEVPVVLNVKDIPDDKMNLLIEKGIIDMSKDSLLFVRLNYPHLLMKYIKLNVAEYVKLIQKRERLFRYEELLQVLSWDEPDELKLNLLAMAKDPVSVIGKDYSAKVRKQILLNYRHEDDLKHLYSRYSKEDEDVQVLILNDAVQNIDIIINEKLPMDEQLINKLLGLKNGFSADREKDENKRIDLLESVMPMVTGDRERKRRLKEKCQKYLDSLGDLGVLGGTNFGYQFRQKSKICEVTNQNTRILNLLRKNGWIDRYELNSADGTVYKFYTSAAKSKKEPAAV